MLKNLLNIKEIKTLKSQEQKVITGGNNCAACYDNCVLTSKDRMELGDCFDACQQTVC
ncbi:hypothetical protein [uncultured Dokdonia sp.]|uniref:hypothetical protein n=1 Tax=uncultured Dokdonia sp. TaxID=575653 RepID=UPI002615797C|nr:hypothetical protein [uncultured Dokdonia sp.]